LREIAVIKFDFVRYEFNQFSVSKL